MRNMLKKKMSCSGSSRQMSQVTSVLPSGETLLGAAAQLSDGWALNRLLQRGNQDPNQIDGQGRTALHRAALTGNQNAAEALIVAGGDVTIRDCHGFTPLQLACVQGHVEVVKTLVKCYQGKDDVLSFEPLLDVVETGSLELVKVLLGPGVGVNITDRWGNTALMTAVKYRRTEIVRLLLENGASPNSTNIFGATALHYAVLSKQCEITRILLNAGCDVSQGHGGKAGCAINYSPLAAAIHMDCKECFELLSEDSESVVDQKDSNNNSPLFYAFCNSWHCDHCRSRGVITQLPNCVFDSNFLKKADDRLHFARRLLIQGADIGVVWNQAMWKTRFSDRNQTQAVSLLIRALSVTANMGPKMNSFVRANILGKQCSAVELLLHAGFTPDENVITICENTLQDTEDEDRLRVRELVSLCNKRPRNLQNLSVIAIRHTLNGHGNILNKAKQLGLPERLEQLVTLEALPSCSLVHTAAWWSAQWLYKDSRVYIISMTRK